MGHQNQNRPCWKSFEIQQGTELDHTISAQKPHTPRTQFGGCHFFVGTVVKRGIIAICTGPLQEDTHHPLNFDHTINRKIKD
jgi:hypothetical protein